MNRILCFLCSLIFSLLCMTISSSAATISATPTTHWKTKLKQTSYQLSKNQVIMIGIRKEKHVRISNITYHTNQKSVISLFSNGTVIAKRPGIAKIRCRIKGTHKKRKFTQEYYCKVTVKTPTAVQKSQVLGVTQPSTPIPTVSSPNSTITNPITRAFSFTTNYLVNQCIPIFYTAPKKIQLPLSVWFEKDAKTFYPTYYHIEGNFQMRADNQPNPEMVRVSIYDTETNTDYMLQNNFEYQQTADHIYSFQLHLPPCDQLPSDIYTNPKRYPVCIYISSDDTDQSMLQSVIFHNITISNTP